MPTKAHELADWIAKPTMTQAAKLAQATPERYDPSYVVRAIRPFLPRSPTIAKNVRMESCLISLYILEFGNIFGDVVSKVDIAEFLSVPPQRAGPAAAWVSLGSGDIVVITYDSVLILKEFDIVLPRRCQSIASG
ncbi:hypothetical protein WICPIJ_008259 [Wickerhamomyces pijperi]|uniref:Uncharacterized protein n=1 Tax=Wickerhamomyces pijperi TaxID=599730 RepID=A0A9P8PZN9_WICPI|nr:hypothetical protein WICPIJ_008259 [Wickerhamomyces pijperi]